MMLHPTFYCDTATWEVEGQAAGSLRALLGQMPPGTQFADYYPKGYAGIVRATPVTVRSYDRSSLLEARAKTQQRRLLGMNALRAPLVAKPRVEKPPEPELPEPVEAPKLAPPADPLLERLRATAPLPPPPPKKPPAPSVFKSDGRIEPRKVRKSRVPAKPAPHGTRSWTEKEDALVRKCVELKVTASQIVVALAKVGAHRTRNSVIGRVHRLGLTWLEKGGRDV